jgi:hypothetical protein
MRTTVLNIIKKHEILIGGITEEQFKEIAPDYKAALKGEIDKKAEFILNGYSIAWEKLYALSAADKVPLSFLEKVIPPPTPKGLHWCFSINTYTPEERKGVVQQVRGTYGSAQADGIHFDITTQVDCLMGTLGRPEYIIIFATNKPYNSDYDEQYLNQPKTFNFGDLIKDRNSSIPETSDDVEGEESSVLSL